MERKDVLTLESVPEYLTDGLRIACFLFSEIVATYVCCSVLLYAIILKIWLQTTLWPAQEAVENQRVIQPCVPQQHLSSLGAPCTHVLWRRVAVTKAEVVDNRLSLGSSG